MIDEKLYYRGFTGSVEYSEEDEVFHGKLLDIRDLVTYEADSISELNSEFIDAVEDYQATPTPKLGVHNKKRGLIHGVGINDADYVTEIKETIGYVGKTQKTKLIWICPFYRKWRHMLERCYSAKCQMKRPTYIGCTVCDEWKYFSKFRAWMIAQDWEGKELDKDLLFRGNKLYSPETCCFLSRCVNVFITEVKTNSGEWPVGVSWNKREKIFVACCQNPFQKKNRGFIGKFHSASEAHEAWRAKKLEYARNLADQEIDNRIKKALVSRYENYDDYCVTWEVVNAF